MKPVQLTEQEFENLQNGRPLNHGSVKFAKSPHVASDMAMHRIERQGMEILRKMIKGYSATERN